MSDDAKVALRLVFDLNLEAKEVARRLATPLPTIRKRFERARAVLGAATTREAARLLAEHEARLDHRRLQLPLPIPDSDGSEEAGGPARGSASGILSRWRDRPNELTTGQWARAVAAWAVVGAVLFLAAVALLGGLQSLMPRAAGSETLRGAVRAVGASMNNTSSTVVTPLPTQRHKRTIAVRKVYTKLRAVERLIDDTLVAGGELTATMPTAAVEAELSTLFGQEALEHVVAAITHLGAARRSMGSAHVQLGKIKGEILMDYDDPNQDDFGSGEKPHNLNISAPVAG